MKDDYDPEILKYYTFRRQPKKYLYIKLRKPIILWRMFLKKVTNSRSRSGLTDLTVNYGNIANQSDMYQKKGYCEISNFLDDASYSSLKDNWPPRMYFKPSATLFKAYDFGFKWIRGDKDPPHLDKFPTLHKFYDLLRSKEFGEIIADMSADGIDRSCFSIACTWATSGSSLIPHKDGVSVRKGGHSFLNLIIFIDANGEPVDSGGTCIFARNNYNEIIFQPSTLKNTVLAYKSDADIYHGFKPIKHGNFRWAILSQFADVNDKNF